jgi:hypothetical protein
MTRSRGRSKEDGEKSRAGKQRGAIGRRAAYRTESQAERSFNPAERAEPIVDVQEWCGTSAWWHGERAGKDSLATQRSNPSRGFRKSSGASRPGGLHQNW